MWRWGVGGEKLYSLQWLQRYETAKVEDRTAIIPIEAGLVMEKGENPQSGRMRYQMLLPSFTHTHTHTPTSHGSLSVWRERQRLRKLEVWFRASREKQAECTTKQIRRLSLLWNKHLTSLFHYPFIHHSHTVSYMTKSLIMTLMLKIV